MSLKKQGHDFEAMSHSFIMQQSVAHAGTRICSDMYPAIDSGRYSTTIRASMLFLSDLAT
jgi:hypothetical protein